MKTERQYWVGVVIDLKKWAVKVLDCNMACVTDSQLQLYCAHISNMLPYLMRKHGTSDIMKSVELQPFLMDRIDLDFGTKSPGMLIANKI